MKKLLVCTTLALLVTACGSERDPKGDAQQPPTPGGTMPKHQVPAEVKVASNAEAWLAYVKQLVEKAEKDGVATIPGTGKDVLLVKELRSLVVGPFWGDAAQTASRAPKADRRDPLPPILAYHQDLQKASIEWLFVPVPAKVAVQPSLVPGAPAVDGRIDIYCVQFYDELRKAGVPVVDLVPTLQRLVKSGVRAHCMTDTHWTPAGCEAAADTVSKRLKQQGWYANAAKQKFGQSKQELTMTGDMASMRKENTPAERLTLQVVDGAKPDPKSPVLLLGDSHCLVFHQGGDMHAKGAGFPDHLMRDLGMPISVLGVRGSGATPSRVDAFRGKHYDGKAAVIWCLSAREFTEGQGWAKVPVKR